MTLETLVFIVGFIIEIFLSAWWIWLIYLILYLNKRSKAKLPNGKIVVAIAVIWGLVMATIKVANRTPSPFEIPDPVAVPNGTQGQRNLDLDATSKPDWYLKIDPELRPPESKVAKLEQIRLSYQIPTEHFYFFVIGSPETTRRQQYIILQEFKNKYRDADERQLWKMVLETRSLTLKSRGASGIAPAKIDQIVRSAISFADVCDHILMLDRRERPQDPSGLEEAIIRAIKN